METAGSNMSNYRRNSISMPVLNTMDLDVLRQLHEQAVQEKMVTDMIFMNLYYYLCSSDQLPPLSDHSYRG